MTVRKAMSENTALEMGATDGKYRTRRKKHSLVKGRMA